MVRLRFVVSLTLALGVGSVGAAQAQNPSRADVDRIFSFLEGGPGCAVAAVRDGRVVHSAGYGLANLEFAVPITPRTVFDLASTSKQFTATAVYLLAREGRVGLDDPVVRYFPELEHLDSAVTVRHLLHHTSGIRDYFTLWSLSGNDIEDAMPKPVILDLLARQRTLNFEPGTREMYSNSNYMLLAELVERVSGRPFRDFVAERVFGPLGMEGARIYDDLSVMVPGRAEGYHELPGGEVGRRVLRSTIVGDGGVYATVEDVARWAAHFDRGGAPGLGGDLITALLEPGRLADGSEHNYAGGLRGLTYRGLRTVEHGGTMGGYRSYFRRFPDQRFTAIALCNLLELSPNQLTARLADLYLGDLMEAMEGAVPEPYLRDAPEEPVTSTGAPAGVDLRDYSGAYGTGELLAGSTVVVEGDLLAFRSGLTDPTPLIHVEGDTFRTAGGVRCVFERDASGKVVSVLIYAGRVREIRFFRSS